jgi:hypothetical protein
MSTCCSEICDGTGVQLEHVHRVRFFGIELPAEVPGSANAPIKRTDASSDARLTRSDAVHTDPQVLFTAQWFDQAMLTRELQKP